MSNRFNYIITIHNKEDLIHRVMMCVLMCARDNSHIYPILDGCTDGTEKAIDAIIAEFSDVPITKVITPDVHELLSINAGLNAADQSGEGFNIVLQDDVLLADFQLERKITALYERMGADLGYVSLRFGANFSKDAATSGEAIPLSHFAENAYAHYNADSQRLMPGQFAYRQIPIKSPVCFPFKLIRDVGILEAKLAPYAHDDTDYAIRCLKAGYRNGVFAVRFRSDLDWGGTRQGGHIPVTPMIVRNMERIREWHGPALAELAAQSVNTQVFDIVRAADPAAEARALEAWEASFVALEEYQGNWKTKLLEKMRSVKRKVFG